MTVTSLKTNSKKATQRKRWQYRSENSTRADAGKDLALALKIHPLTARLLAVRGFTDAAQAEPFLQPRLNDLHDPALLPGADRAAKRLLQAVKDQQRIIIFGDYDVDGITASAVLWHMLKLAGAQVETYVPHRVEEGYGLNVEAITKLCKGEHIASGEEIIVAQIDEETAENQSSSVTADSAEKKPLIISVDCGITAIEPAKVAKNLGVDLIITDHHEFDADHLPEAHTLVHPRLPGSQYPFADLCGAGVALKVAWQFARVYCGSQRVSETFRTLLLDLLSLAALGTVADVVPLVGENRILASFGLGQIKSTRFIGLNALIDASRLRDEKIDAYDVGFKIGPRLNACGRMGHASRAVHLLTAAEEEAAVQTATFLTNENDRRRATEKNIFEQAREMIETNGFHAENMRAIVVGKEGWHVGVVGIVASRLVEAFSRPVVMLSFGEPCEENKEAIVLAHGSARSVENVSIHEALTHCAEHLTSFGGHAMAAGMKLPVANVDAFRNALVEYVNAQLPVENLVGKLEVDALCTLDELNMAVLQEIDRLAPFGRSNPAPLFRVNDVMLDEKAQRMGKQGQHLRLFLRQGRRVASAVGWSMGDFVEQLVAGVVLDAVFEARLSTWNGQRRVELEIKDFLIKR